MLSPWITESSDRAGSSHRPDGAEISRSSAYPGFHPGLFSSPPYGRKCGARVDVRVKVRAALPAVQTAAGD